MDADRIRITDSEAPATVASSLLERLNDPYSLEGVETEEQAAFLRAQGCGELQGFLTGAPCAASDFTRSLEREKADEENP
jgi:EAL domain-containing protein (putative c-di-GMP-specific phosphodiesterase class I)